MDVPYRAVFEASPDGIVIVDHEGVIRHANPKAHELFGYGSGELEGEGAEVLVPEELRDRHRNHRSHYLVAPTPRPMGIGMELRGRKKDGTTVPVEISLSPLAFKSDQWVIVSVRDVSERRRLRRFGIEALRAAEEERRRIARELHDDTAQALSGLLVRLRVLERTTDERTRRRLIEEMRDGVVGSVEGVRRISRGLRPPALEDVGVVAALRGHLRAFLDGSHLEVRLDSDPVDGLLDENRALVLYRVIQEAVTNVARHADASSLKVEISGLEDEVCAMVEDDGRGFDPREPEVLERGLGLMGMRERAASVGGSLLLRSREGGGTRVELRLPLDRGGESDA